MELKLTRRWLTEKSTIGELFVDGIFECYTLEDRYLGDEVKEKGKSCIPCGTYQVALRHSPKFNGAELPVIFTEKVGERYIIHSPERKVQFEQCMFHAGNVPGETEGCPLVGRDRLEDRIERSRLALVTFVPKVKAAINTGEAVTLKVEIADTAGLFC